MNEYPDRDYADRIDKIRLVYSVQYTYTFLTRVACSQSNYKNHHKNYPKNHPKNHPWIGVILVLDMLYGGVRRSQIEADHLGGVEEG